MNSIQLGYKFLDEEVLRLYLNDQGFPHWGSKKSAGFDVKSSVNAVIERFDTFAVPTGIAFDIPEGYELQVRGRSGLALTGIFVPNSPGTIDCDYKGELKVILMNLSKGPFVIEPGDRIAQIVMASTVRPIPYETLNIGESERGEGGFGSTGI